MTAKVTIAIPTHNGAKFLGETIRSLLDQTYRDFELVVVDDASTDASVDVAQSAGVRVVKNATRLGLAGNWNRAAQLVTSPYFVLAHQDDIYEPGHLATMLPLIEAHPRAFIAHCKTISIDENGSTIDTAAARYKEMLWPRRNPYESAAAEELPRLARGNYIICPSVVFRSATVKQIGRFAERFQFVTDWEYWVRGSAAGYTIVGTHARLVRFRRHQATATRSVELSFDRYREEIAMEEIIAQQSRGIARLRRGSHPALRILASEFASLLRAADRARASELLDFARREVPGFKRSPIAIAMRAALVGGRAGGHALKMLENLALRWAAFRGR